MKQFYLTPETSVHLITLRGSVMNNVSNTGLSSSNLTIVNATEESDWEF